MKSARISHTLITFSLFLVAVTFLAGVLHVSEPARAASATPAANASHQTGNETELTPTPSPTPVSVSGDTTGIIALAIVIVIIVLVGAIMGTNRPYKKKTF
jgi:DMSO reductase anchor subunit